MRCATSAASARKLNPLRAFDCKSPHCHEIMQGAPLMPDSLCDECREHYAKVKQYLDAAGIAYVEDPTLVRGLDYYTRTVFEVEAPGRGRWLHRAAVAVTTVWLSSRAASPRPGVGFAVGFERAVLALEAFGKEMDCDADRCVFVANAGADLRDEVFALALELRGRGVRTECDYQGKSLKAQFKLADKLNASHIVIIGGDELAAGKVKLRNMATHEESLIERASAARGHRGAVAARFAHMRLSGMRRFPM